MTNFAAWTLSNPSPYRSLVSLGFEDSPYFYFFDFCLNKIFVDFVFVFFGRNLPALSHIQDTKVGGGYFLVWAMCQLTRIEK